MCEERTVKSMTFADELEESPRDDWEISISHIWRIRPNPYGNGLLLLVERGIPCANHTQVVSGYCDNIFDKEDVEEALRTMPDLVSNINRFFSQLEIHEETYDGEKDEEAIVFLYWVIRDITKKAEAAWIDRYEYMQKNAIKNT